MVTLLCVAMGGLTVAAFASTAIYIYKKYSKKDIDKETEDFNDHIIGMTILFAYLILFALYNACFGFNLIRNILFVLGFLAMFISYYLEDLVGLGFWIAKKLTRLYFRHKLNIK